MPSSRPLTTLLDLPSEIIYQIHSLSQNPHFPLINHHIHQTLCHPPSTYSALYLLSLYTSFKYNQILWRCLRHPICTLETAKEIRRVWDKRRGYTPPPPIQPPKPAKETPEGSDEDEEEPKPPVKPRYPGLKCAELPRRLLRLPLNRSQPIHPMIRYLFEEYSPSPNAPDGYPLARAVLSSNYDLIAFLLDKGADPGMKDGLAVEVAISKKDIRAVKMLVEARYSEGGAEKEEDVVDRGGSVKRRERGGKRRKVGDRVVISQRLVEVAMKKGSREIVHYFVHEKGILPPLNSIMKLGEAKVSPTGPTGKQCRRR